MVLYIKFIKPRVKSIVKRRFIVTGLILLFFIEPIITNLVAGFYILTMPRAENIKVDYPISVYDDSQRNSEKELIGDIKTLDTLLDGIYVAQLATNVKDKVYLFSCNYDSNKGYDEFVKSCIDSKRVYTKETMPKMDYYIIKKDYKGGFFVGVSDYKIIDKNNRLIYIIRTTWRRHEYLLYLNLRWIMNDADLLYEANDGALLGRVSLRKDMDKARLEQPKVKEFTNLN